jgi:hypothetical protein
MADIRCRDVSPELAKKFDAICEKYNLKTMTAGMTFLIDQYEPREAKIVATEQRNRELQKEIARYIDREQEQKQIIEQFIKSTGNHSKQLLQFHADVIKRSEQIARKFTGSKRPKKPAAPKKAKASGTKKQPAGRRSAPRKAKNVPKKKGGKK